MTYRCGNNEGTVYRCSNNKLSYCPVIIDWPCQVKIEGVGVQWESTKSFGYPERLHRLGANN